MEAPDKITTVEYKLCLLFLSKKKKKKKKPTLIAVVYNDHFWHKGKQNT